ncbi:MAG TPA: hypothetical protein VEK07_19635 [Polyangiaceae bacterium]|nr:hypothetical protein [Polyangiaceae bacterium]
MPPPAVDVQLAPGTRPPDAQAPVPVQAPPGPYPTPVYPPAPQGYAPPPTYAPAPGYAGAPQPLPAPYGPLPPVLQPPRPRPSRYRSAQEMAFLYGTGVAYGIGTGIWIDALAKESDPGIAVIAPAAFGAAVPIGLYIWDQLDEFDRAVPSTIATGLLLGSVEGVAISGLQWQVTGNGGPRSWDFQMWTTITFLTATAGGVGGYAFGEWLQPDPRSLSLISSAAGWGAITGVLFGAGVVNGDWKDGAAVWGFAGYNAGILSAGVVSAFYVPSWVTIRSMWAGEVLGTLATTPIYLFYIGSSGDEWRRGMIANSVGGLAGLAIAAVFTANSTDSPNQASWTPPFQVAVAPTQHGGAQLSAFGSF